MFRSKNRTIVPLCAAVSILAACGQGGSTVPASAPVNPASRILPQQSHRIAPGDTTSILKNLKNDVIIGSTVDPNNGDQGPHSLAIVKAPTYGKLKKGDLVVCNFADSSGNAGKGTTIELLAPQPSSTPVPFAQSNDIKGCAGTAISHFYYVYATGLTSGSLASFDWNGNENGTNGSPLAAPFSDVDATVKGPYGSEYIFTSDQQTGSIVSLGLGYASGEYLQVATGFAVSQPSQTGWSALGPSGLQYNQKSDTLYIADGVNNTIDAFHHASALLVKNEIVVESGGKKFKCIHKKTTCGKFVYGGSPLNAPVAMTILPNGNLIVANTAAGTSGGNMLVELTPKGQILDTKIVDSGPTPAIFGLAASGTNDGNTVVFYTDTNDNNVHELEP